MIKDGQVTNVFSQRKHISDDKCQLHGSTPDFGAFSESSLYEVGDRGKHHFSATYSDAMEWRQGKSRIEVKKSTEHIEKGKKVLLPTRSEEQVPGHVRLFPKEYIKKSDTNDKLFETRHVVLKEGTSVPMKSLRSEEFQFELYMNRKQRIRSSYEQRNGIPTSTMGDKAYKGPEHSDKYYAIGGLVAGSTISMKASKSIVMKKGGDNQARTRETRKLVSYAEKTALARKEEEVGDVRVLTVMHVLYFYVQPPPVSRPDLAPSRAQIYTYYLDIRTRTCTRTEYIYLYSRTHAHAFMRGTTAVIRSSDIDILPSFFYTTLTNQPNELPTECIFQVESNAAVLGR